MSYDVMKLMVHMALNLKDTLAEKTRITQAQYYAKGYETKLLPRC